MDIVKQFQAWAKAQEKKLLTKSEAAARAAVSVKQLNRLINAGEIPVVSLGKSARGDRVDPRDLDSYLLRSKKSRKSCQLSERVTAPIKLGSNSINDKLSARFGDLEPRPRK